MQVVYQIIDAGRRSCFAIADTFAKVPGEKSVRRAYRPDSVRRASPAGNHSSGRGIAAALWPSTRMLERAALSAKACACLFDVAPDRGCRVSPCGAAPVSRRAARRWPCRCMRNMPAPQTRLCGPVPRLGGAPRAPPRRTAVSRYPALWSPDLPRCHRHRDCPARLTAAL